MPELTDTLYGNEIQRWLLALGVSVGILITLRLVEQVLIVRVHRLSEKTENIIDDAVIGALRKTKFLFLLVVALFIGSLWLNLDAQVRSIIRHVLVIVALIQGGIWVSAGLQLWLERYRAKEQDGANRTTMNALSFIARLVLWVMVFLLVIDNLGVDVTALVAGMGIGGIAIALAVQNILSDLFSSLSIVLDKPFVNGDFIVVGDLAGSVEHVGVKTTRIRSISGEQLIFSNSDLLQSRIRNFGRMNQRRVVFTLGVTYQTPADKLAKIPSMIREAVEAQQQVRFDRSHFAEYGDSALNFETVYYVELSDYTTHMDIRQAINLAIFDSFEAAGIEFAYPTQTLFVSKE